MSREKYKPEIVRAYYASQGLPAPTFEFQFHPERKWRFDMAWPKQRVALEVEGLNGRHQRTAGFLKDMEKYSVACSMGWRIIRVPTKEVCMMDTINMIKKTMRWKTTRRTDEEMRAL